MGLELKQVLGDDRPKEGAVGDGDPDEKKGSDGGGRGSFLVCFRLRFFCCCFFSVVLFLFLFCFFVRACDFSDTTGFAEPRPIFSSADVLAAKMSTAENGKTYIGSVRKSNTKNK